MPSSPLSVAGRTVALLLPLACSQGEAAPGDALRFVPEGLSSTNVDGQDEGLTLVAFTLATGASGPELYAAVRNDGSTPACEAGMLTDFFDKANQRMTSAGSALQSSRLYRLEDGTVISCIAPGETAMTAATDLPDAVVIEEVGHLEHQFPSFTVAGIVPIAGLTVSEVQARTTGEGHAYAGKLTNNLEVAVSAAKVTIFPLNRVGRPLGVATSERPDAIPAGASWSFATSSVGDPGVGHADFPAATLAP